MRSKISIVIGLGFGDEGKGSTTSFIVDKAVGQLDKPVVIRFNGGHQAGHTVVTENGTNHLFSSFGSGTLQGVPTYTSQFCTVYPIALYNEWRNLCTKISTQSMIKLYVHPLAMVTTPYDILANKYCNIHSKNGTVGVGFGHTVKRHEEYYKLYVQDLFYPAILNEKLRNIEKYYMNIYQDGIAHELNNLMDEWLKSIEIIKNNHLIDTNFKPYEFNHLIFEGAQGVMLDMDFGFFPNVTRSNTTCKNAMSLIKEFEVEDYIVDMYNVTRAYQTRHGNGFLNHEDNIALINTKSETNVFGEHQGYFRLAPLDIDQLKYAMNSNNMMAGNVMIENNLVITCIDQIPDKNKILYIHNNTLLVGNLQSVLNRMSDITLHNVYTSYSNVGINMKLRHSKAMF